MCVCKIGKEKKRRWQRKEEEEEESLLGSGRKVLCGCVLVCGCLLTFYSKDQLFIQACDELSFQLRTSMRLNIMAINRQIRG